jgi:hypothetical protein
MAVSGMSENGGIPIVFADTGFGFELPVPRQRTTPLTDRGVKPQATAAGCHFGEILPQGATLMMALSVSFSGN